MMFKPTPIALAIILGAGAAPLASAQESGYQGGQQGAAPNQQAPTVSKSQLSLFQKASGKVAEIRQEYQQALPDAGSTEEAQTLQEEASQAMVNAVQSFGLSVDEFNQIAEAVQTNPELQERLTEMQDS